MPITISGSTGIAGVDGSASTPAVQGTDTNTGIAFPAADTVAIGTGGSERMRVNSSGNVGIGTSSPNKSGSNLALTLNTALGQYGAYELSTNDVGRWYINADATNVYDTAMNNTNRTFYTGGSERMRIDTSGNVGIGTSSPGSLLTVNGNLSFNSGYGSAAVAYGCRAWVNFNGTGTVAIRASGNVSSITDNGVGDYAVNFTNAMPDANYGAALSALNIIQTNNQAYGAFRITSQSTGGIGVDMPAIASDPTVCCVSIFR